jgi:hypothetical protein
MKGSRKRDTEAESMSGTNTEERKTRKPFYRNTEAVAQFCIQHSIGYFPNVLSFSKPLLCCV